MTHTPGMFGTWRRACVTDVAAQDVDEARLFRKTKPLADRRTRMRDDECHVRTRCSQRTGELQSHGSAGPATARIADWMSRCCRRPTGASAG